MELTLLGTGNAQATKIYNTTLLFDDGKERLLVDGGGGNGILSILEKKNIPLSSINYLFITHAHTDHLLGCFWIIRRIAEEMNKDSYFGSFTVFASKSVLDLIIPFLNAVLTKKICSLFGKRIFFVTIRDRVPIPFMSSLLTPFDIKSTKLEQFGFILEKDGIKIVDSGDEPLNEENFILAENADYLTHEAFCLYADRDRFHPYEKNHSTVKDAAELSQKLNVKNLILYHTEDVTDITTRKSRYTLEGKAYYKGRIFVPDDGETIKLS